MIGHTMEERIIVSIEVNCSVSLDSAFLYHYGATENIFVFCDKHGNDGIETTADLYVETTDNIFDITQVADIAYFGSKHIQIGGVCLMLFLLICVTALWQKRRGKVERHVYSKA